MRKSSAPSSKFVKSATNLLQNSGGSLNKDESVSGKTTNNVLRNTESVLGLLTNIIPEDNSVKEEETPSVLQEVHQSTSNLNESETSLNSRKLFSVVYGKQTKKKHKTWEGDGTLEVADKNITLKDVDGKVIGTARLTKQNEPVEGGRIFVGSKEVEILDLLKNDVVSTPTELKRPALDCLEKKVTKKSRYVNKFHTPLLNVTKEKASSSCLFVLPEPSADHQWKFNTSNEPLHQVSVDSFLARKLRTHQRQGVIFLYECVMGFQEHNYQGAILADEMGLGKTLQCISLIWTLLKQNPYGKRPSVQKVLIVTPSSLTNNWKNEFEKWLGKHHISPFVVNQKNKINHFLSQPPSSNSVMIISYEMLVRGFDHIQEINFDLIICDEGHRLKNSSIRTYQMLNQLLCNRRILLTGTPMQNDLSEFYTLVDFVNPGVLGTLAQYKKQFEDPIVASRQPNIDEDVKLLGEERAAELNQLTCRFILRRTQEILDGLLPTKHEVVVFCKLSPLQTSVYSAATDFLENSKTCVTGFSDGVAHLGLITTLKKICNHPALIRCEEMYEDKEQETLNSFLQQQFPSTEEIFSSEHSTKLVIVINLLRLLRSSQKKEKVVLVSYYTQTLDMIADICAQQNFPYCRLDGSTSASQRIDIVDKFNSPGSNIFAFLLSAKAGGVGLNLTGASRLILYDTDWNPASDLQAMSRIWRDGQKHSVYIYRLLTSGTIEEKIYQRQISKQGLSGGVVDAQQNYDLKLTKEELKDIFSLSDRDCSTHDILNCNCNLKGSLQSTEEDENRTGKLEFYGQLKSQALIRMNELIKWRHYGYPYSEEILRELCLKNVEHLVSFIFKNSTQ